MVRTVANSKAHALSTWGRPYRALSNCCLQVGPVVLVQEEPEIQTFGDFFKLLNINCLFKCFKTLPEVKENMKVDQT